MIVQKLYLDALNQSHVLAAGCTGSGKSVLLDNLIYTHFAAIDAAAVLLDPKRVGLRKWATDTRVVMHEVTPAGIRAALAECCAVMDSRYSKMERRGLEETDAPHVYLYIDELADLMQTDPEAVNSLLHLLRLGRAAGVHVVAATQDPSRKTLPAALQQNFTGIFALRCRSRIESRQIIGYPGAEELPLYGQALYLTPAYRQPVRVNIDLLPPAQLAAAIQSRTWPPRKAV